MKFLDHFRRKSTEPWDPDIDDTAGGEEISGSMAGKERNPARRSPPLAEGAPDIEGGKTTRSEPSPSQRRPPTEAGICFSLADFIQRIPSELLRDGPHDVDFELFFEANDVAQRIAHGYSTIPLAEIYKRAPHIFKGEVRDSDNIEIRFPWQKLMNYVAPDDGVPKNIVASCMAADLATKVRSHKEDAAQPAPPGGAASQIVSPRNSDASPPAFSKPVDEAPRTETRTATPTSENQLQLLPTEEIAKPAPEPEAATVSVGAEKDKAVHLQNAPALREMEDQGTFSGVRESLQKTLDEQAKALEELKTEIGQTRRDAEEKVNVLTQERDVLLQQKNHLSEQLAQVRNRRGGGPTSLAGSAEPGEGVARSGQLERSKREYQRQIDELHRRIAAFENNQKEAAHELSKERESRIKVERALAAAERVRTEATALVESMRADTRRELEAGLRKRESESARAQQEMQEQLEAVAQEKAALVAERKELVARMEAEQRKAEAERQQLVAKLEEQGQAAAERQRSQSCQNELEQIAAAAPSRDEPATGWESRAVASLESDIESYRARIKALLCERDAWSKEREKLAAELAESAQRVSSAASAEERLREATTTNEKLAANVLAAANERDRLVAQLRSSDERITEAEGDAARRLHDLINERDQAIAETAKVRASLAQIEADHQLRVAGFEGRREALLKEKFDAVGTLEEIQQRHAAELQRVATARLADQVELENLRARVQELQAVNNQRQVEFETMRKAGAVPQSALSHDADTERTDEVAVVRARYEHAVAQLQEENARLVDAARNEREQLCARLAELEKNQAMAAQFSALIRAREDAVIAALGEGAEVPEESATFAPTGSKEDESDETNVIEIGGAELITTNDAESIVHLPRVRPVPIPPPQVRVI